MSDNDRARVIRGELERLASPNYRGDLDQHATAILEALDRHDDALVASMPRAWPEQVVVRVEVILPDRLQPDRTKQVNGARVLLATEAVAPGLAATIGPTIEAIIGDAAQTIIDGVRP